MERNKMKTNKPIQEKIKEIMKNTKIEFKLVRFTNDKNIYTMTTGQEFDAFIEEIESLVTQSNKAYLLEFVEFLEKQTIELREVNLGYAINKIAILAEHFKALKTKQKETEE